jgi:hypothetical protein
MPQKLEAIPPTNRKYYGIGQRATRVIDLRMDHKGNLTVSKREPDGTNVWRETASAGSFAAKKGRPVKWVVEVPVGEWALISVQAEDWPSSYNDPNFMALGLLNAFSGYGQEVSLGNESPQALLNTKLYCSLTLAPATKKKPEASAILTFTTYGKRKVGKNWVENDMPTTAATVDLKSMWDPTMAVGVAHMVVRLTDIPAVEEGNAVFRNHGTVSINDGAPFGYS